jgi:hypothetical protein
MLRWSFRIIVTLLFVTCLSFWVRSYWRSEMVLHEQTTHQDLTFTTRQCVLASGRGGIFLGHRHNVLTLATQAQAEKRASKPDRYGWTHTIVEDPSYAGGYFQKTGNTMKIGFGRHTGEMTSPKGDLKIKSYVFPYAAPTTLFGLLPIWWIFRHFFPAPKQRKLIASPEFADNDYLRSPHEPLAPRT